eukprot:UN17990
MLKIYDSWQKSNKITSRVYKNILFLR